MFYTSKKVQLKIYYLFMLADGKCSADEKEKFTSICKSMDVNDDEKKEVIGFCENLINVSGSDNSARVIREITNLLAEEGKGIFFGGSLNKNKCKQVESMWTLINLGYADAEYSEAEKKVVSFLTDYWEIDAPTLADLNDTAETVLALTRQKDWVKTTNKPYDVVSANIAEIDEAVSRMAKNIEILISEADVA